MGITIRKSLSIEFPNVEDKFKKHVIRGIFDGDGSVYVNRTSTNYKGIRKLFDYLYNDSEVFLKRKKDIFNKMI